MRRWCVVLISPKSSGNIGSAARVMKNFNVRELRIVEPRCEVENDDSRALSSGAAEVLRNVKIFESLEDALADCELSIGLTGVSGRNHRLDCIELIPRKLLENKESLQKCALVFGREDLGMKGEDMDRCDFLWGLPTDPIFPSLNLAQAIAIALSSIAEIEKNVTDDLIGIAASKRSLGVLAGSEDAQDKPATNGEVNYLLNHFEQLMKEFEWDQKSSVGASLGLIRSLLARATATKREVDLLHGICHQSLKKHQDKK